MIKSTQLVWGDLAGQATEFPAILNLQIGEEVFLQEPEVRDKALTVTSKTHLLTREREVSKHTLIVVLG